MSAFEWVEKLKAWVRPPSMSDAQLTTGPHVTTFNRETLKLTMGDTTFDVQPTFKADDPRIPYWIAEHLETQSLKREYAKEQPCAE